MTIRSVVLLCSSLLFSACSGGGGGNTDKPQEAPVAVNDTASVAQDSSIDINVLANDTDGNGDTLTVTAVTAPQNGQATINSDNTVHYVPNSGYNGADSFAYTISDGNGGEASASVTLTVNAPANIAPVANDDVETTAQNVAISINVVQNDTDANSDSLTVISTTQGSSGTVSINTDKISVTYTPNTGFSGTDNFDYTITDGNGGEATATVTVTVTAPNLPPVAVDDTATTDQNVTIPIDVTSNDTDPNGDSLTIISTTQGSNGSVSIDTKSNLVNYTPNTDFLGNDSFGYTVSDGNGGEASATVSVTVQQRVNTAPVANADSATTPKNVAKLINVTTNDFDADKDLLTVISTTQGTNGTVVINSKDSASVTYAPNTDFIGTDTFSYTISDGNGGEATATVTVTVFNSIPVANDDSARTLQNTAVPIDVIANDTDTDGDTLTVIGTTQGSNGSVSIDPGNTSVTYTPNTDYVGVDSFQYTISDGNTGEATATVNITVTFGYPPVAASDFATTDVNKEVIIDALANDTDADNDPLSISSVGTAGNGSVIINADNTLTYTPNADFVGTDQFTYTISDGNNTADGLVYVTVTSSVTANNDFITVKSGTSTNIDVLANDTNQFTDALVISANTNVSHGTLVKNANSTFTYTPATGYVGQDFFNYTIVNGSGGIHSATVAITITTDPGSGPYLAYSSDSFLFAVEKTNPSVRVLLTDKLNTNYSTMEYMYDVTVDTVNSVYTYNDPRSLIYASQNEVWQVDMSSGSTLTPQKLYTSANGDICEIRLFEDPIAYTDNMLLVELSGPDLSCSNGTTDNSRIIFQVAAGVTPAPIDISSHINFSHHLHVLREGLPNSGAITGYLTDNSASVMRFSADWGTSTVIKTGAAAEIQFQAFTLTNSAFVIAGGNVYLYDVSTNALSNSLFTFDPTTTTMGDFKCDNVDCYFDTKSTTTGSPYVIYHVPADGSASANLLTEIQTDYLFTKSIGTNSIFISSFSQIFTVSKSDGATSTENANISFIALPNDYLYYNVAATATTPGKAVVKNMDGVVVTEIPDAKWSDLRINSLNLVGLLDYRLGLAKNNNGVETLEAWSWKTSGLSKDFDIGVIPTNYIPGSLTFGNGPQLSSMYTTSFVTNIFWMDFSAANSLQQLTDDSSSKRFP